MAQNFHVSVPQHRGNPLKASIEKIKAAALDPDNDSEIAELVRIGMERANDPERQQLIDKLKRNNKSAFAKLGVDEVELAMLSTSTLRKLSARLAERKNANTETLVGLSSDRARSRTTNSDMRRSSGTTHLVPRPAPYASERDKQRAAAFMPESSLIAHLARTDPKAAVAVASAITERRALTAKAMNYETATAGRQVYASARDQQRAAEFIPPSSLDVWKAMQDKKAPPESDVIEDDKRATREALAHEADMRAMLTGKKPATRSAPKSDRRR